MNRPARVITPELSRSPKAARPGSGNIGDPASSLLPCPFCGEVEELYPCHHGIGGGKPYAIDCLGCGIEFTPRDGADVIAAWNRRTLLGVKR